MFFKLVLSSLLLVAVYGRPQQHSRESESRILNQIQDISPEGRYVFQYETENGIAAQEQGALKQIGNELGIAAQGSYQYTAPDGQQISVTYIADENGFQPQGAHLPTPPPIPPQILKALAYLEAHPDPASREPTRFA